MVDVTEISAVVAAAGVLVGVIYYVMDLRHQSNIRRTDLNLRLYSIANSSEFLDAFGKIDSLQVKGYEDYVEQYIHSPTESSMSKAFITIISFYSLLGQLLKRNLIDIDLVYDNIGSSYPLALYEKVKPIIIGTRKKFNEPTAMIEFEYLCDELKRKEPQLRKTWRKYLSQSS
jgi:hypothetical protein